MSELEFVKEHARLKVRGGFESREACIEMIDEMIEDEGLSDVSAAQLVDVEIALLKEDAKGWPEQTDNDRLEEVFAKLEKSGIIVRQNFTCCGTCGAAEIGDEFTSYLTSGQPVRGYAFYHQQGTERAVEGFGIAFSYGSADKNASDDEHVAIAQELYNTLKAQGFSLDWTGSLSMCVMLDMTWQRRWGSEIRFVQTAV